MDYQELISRIESQDREIYTSADPDNTCPVCHGSGWEPVEQYTDSGELYRAVKKCTACGGNHAQKVREAKALADIPEDRILEAFDWGIYTGYDLSREKRIIDKFVENFYDFESEGMGLFLTSKTRGSGKTFLAQCVGGEILNRYEASTVFVNASDLLDISQKRTDEGEDPIDRMISCRVLILDDLGQKQTGRDWLADVLFRIIDKRYQKKRIVIVTSNDLLRELDFDDRIVDRLNAMTCLVKLPEYCVRSQEANSRKKEILHRLGID